MPRQLFAWGLSAACTRVSLSSTVQYIDPIEVEQDLSRRYTMQQNWGHVIVTELRELYLT